MKFIRNHSAATRRGLAAVAAGAAIALLAAGCSGTGGTGSTDNPGGGGDDGTTITFIPKNLNNPYTDVELKGAEDASKDLGFVYNKVGSLEASADSQIPFIQTEVQNGTQIIAIAANDPDAVCPALEDARSGGAKIIAFDSDTNVKCRDLFINQVTVDSVAKGQLEQLYDQIGGEGDIAILSAAATATNQNAWIDEMKKQIADNPDWNWNLVATVYGDDDDNKSFQEAQGLLQSYPNLKGIISPTTVGIAATARYLSTSDYKGKVALVGLGLPGQMKEYVKDGTVKAFALWDPSEIGYMATYAGKALLDGTITGKEGDTFDAGKLGKKTVGKDGLVIVGELLKFTPENIDDYDYISF
jgi:rhamnose transport system substrate-binding protein